MIENILPSKAYFENGGPFPTGEDISAHSSLARHIERMLVQYGEEDGMDQTGEALVESSFNIDYKARLRKEILIGGVSSKIFETCLLAVRERGYWLEAADQAWIKAKRTRRNKKVMTGGAFLILFTLAGILFVGPPPQPSSPQAQYSLPSSFSIPKHKPATTQKLVIPGNRGGFLLFGKKDAPQRLDLWVNFTCPHCSNAFDTIKRLAAKQNIAVYIHNLPGQTTTSLSLSLYYAILKDKAPDVARKFVDWAYTNQKSFASGIQDKSLNWVAEEIASKMTVAELTEELSSSKVAKQIQLDATLAKQTGVTKSPTLFVGKKQLIGNDITAQNIQKLIGG